jgi:hypothetical protein
MEREIFPNLHTGPLVPEGMNHKTIQTKFEQLGARVKFRPFRFNFANLAPGSIRIDVSTDRRGEFYEIEADKTADLLVLDLQPRDRHLLLMSREPATSRVAPETKSKFLCGHDERHWFVAGVPESAPVSSVVTAMEALKPGLVRDLERGLRGKRERRLRRKTPTFKRQGEWFFIPAPELKVDSRLVLRDEPLRRGAGKPHLCERLYRTRGTTVYVNFRFPNGLTEKERQVLLARNPDAAKWAWQVMQRDPVTYIHGRVSHADHATIRLDGWHRVLMNTESQSRARESVAFLD